VTAFDADREILRERGSSSRPAMAPETVVHLLSDSTLVITELDGHTFQVAIPPTELELVSLLAARHAEGAADESVSGRSWDLRELAEHLDVLTETVRRYIHDVNQGD
jgi:hypothetical protein